jgi:hypothetical protein
VDYAVVFDAARGGYPNWSFVAVGFLFIAIGAGLVLFRHTLATKRRAWLGRTAGALFAYFFLCFALFWTLAAFVVTHGAYAKVRDALAQHRAEVVEGRVEDFSPMPYGGHAFESFTVCGVRFSYSDYVISPGFNRTSTHGGPMRSDLWVRVTFVGDVIARLEIAKTDPGIVAQCRRYAGP